MRRTEGTGLLDRKAFIGGVLASVGSVALPASVLAADKRLLMRFGVASDVHILRGWKQEDYLEKALRWFDAQKADAVLFPGDMAHTGRVSELESIAAVWEKVFPNCTAADGRRVERMLVTGNHEISQWSGLWDRFSDEELRKIRFDYDREHMNATWRRLFGEDYELIWKREVKGVTFIGAQYPISRVSKGYHNRWHQPDYRRFFAEHAAELRQDKPVIFFQHGHPAHTCYGEEASPAWPDMEMHEVLADFPNLVAISGHSHNSPCDERSVWQGSFTSIGAGSVVEAGPCYSRTRYDNGGAPYDPRYKKQRMKCPPQVGNDGRACLLVEVYADHLVVKRRSLAWDESLGPDWEIPVPARPGGEYDFVRRAATRPAPQFAPTAKAVAEICTKEPESTGPGLKGKPVVRVSFPCAETVKGTRVFDYVVKAFADGREVVRSTVLSYGYYLPEARSHVEGECILGQHELPKGKDILFTVTPRDCYGIAGAALASNTIRLAK